MIPVGIGLRSAHYHDIIERKPSSIGWLEVHPENYFGGGANRRFLKQIGAIYPLSFHGVGLSLGSAHGVSDTHLGRLKCLMDEVNPFMVSEHAAWSASGNAHLNDLLPLPYTAETLDVLCRNIDKTQKALGRRILLENPSTYLMFAGNEMSEAAFMNTAVQKTGCGLLLDVNNIYIQSHNHCLDPFAYIDEIDASAVGEIHLAGHTIKETDGECLLIDTHNKAVCEDVWALYTRAIERVGYVPTLIEWDQDIPELDVLLAQAHKASEIMGNMTKRQARYDAA